MPSKETKPILILTDRAHKQLKRFMTDMGKEKYGLKIEVIPGGCSGYTYFMDFQEKPDENDEVIEVKKIKVFVDKNSLEILTGTKMDYLKTEEEEGFIFDNPNSNKCGGCTGSR